MNLNIDWRHPPHAASLLEVTLRGSVHVGGCQNYDPFLGTLNSRCRIIIGIQNGSIILTTTHVHDRHSPCTTTRSASQALTQLATQMCTSCCGRHYSAPQVDRIWGIWGSYYDIPKAIFYLLEGYMGAMLTHYV